MRAVGRIVRILHPRHRWFRFSLRTLLLLVTLCAVLLGWKVNRATRQRETVAALQRAGATVLYDYQYSHDPQNIFGKVTLEAAPKVPWWLPRSLGVDYYHKVVSVSFPSGGSATNEDLRNLRGLGDLQVLLISGIQISDADLVHFAGLRRLENLAFEYSELSGAGLAQLNRLDRLERLYLSGAGLHDDDLKPLASLEGLKELNLQYNRIKGDGLQYLTSLKSLKRLWLKDTLLSDAAVPHLAKMKSLESIALSGTLLSDESIHYLVQALPNWDRKAIWRPVEFSSPVRELRYAKLREELGLSTDQIAVVDDAHRVFLRETAFRPPPKQGWGRFIEIAFRPEEDVASARERQWRQKILNSEQQARMEQIDLQRACFRYGIKVLLRPDVVQRLQVTPEQQMELRRLADSAIEHEREEILHGRAGASLRARRARFREGVDVLDADQRIRWEGMIGAPFDVALRWFLTPIAQRESPASVVGEKE